MRLLIIQILLLAFFSNISCSKARQQTIIIGDIPNLPNGKMYLFEESGLNKIDSVEAKNGKFKIVYNWKKREPVYLGLSHKDKNGLLRLIGFPTHAKYKGSPLMQSRFLSDSIISIGGYFFDNTPEIFPKNVKSADLKNHIICGNQTKALYDIDEDLFEKIDDKTVVTVREKLRKYPFSYHLLFKINENKNSFSAQQVDEFLKLFKGDITESETYKNLLVYNQKRFSEEKLALPMLMNNNGVKQQILGKNYKKHLIVFWASWCGPCRKEIPFLKEFYNKKNSELEFISISIDDNKNDWAKALNLERMPWKQLIVSNEQEKEAMQLQFKLNSAIPYSVLVDSNLKIISSSTGLSNKEELEKLINN